MLCRNEELGRKQRACQGTNTAVESQEHWFQKSEHFAKNAKKRPSNNHAGVATSCASNAPRIDVAAQSGLRVGFRDLSLAWETSTSPVEPHLVVTLRTCLQVEEKMLEPPKLSFSEPKLWTPFLTHIVYILCRSAVRSRLKRDIKLDKVLAVCLAPLIGATLMRAQRVALSLFAFCAKQGFPTTLVQPCASLLWQAPIFQTLLQSHRYSDVHLDVCRFGLKMRRPTRVLLANVDPCDACHVNFTCSRSGSTHRETSEPIPSVPSRMKLLQF